MIDYFLGNEIVIEKRTRYNIWDLLSDVGGFNDGLMLVCQLLTGAYAAASFTTSFIGQQSFSDNFSKGTDDAASPVPKIIAKEEHLSIISNIKKIG